MDKRWVVELNLIDRLAVSKTPVVIYETTRYAKAFFVFAITYFKLVLGTIKSRLKSKTVFYKGRS